MLNNLLAFALGALTFAGATAPSSGSQAPMISCDLNIGTAAITAKSCGGIEEGVYRITNEQTPTLRVYEKNSPISGPPTWENPGRFEMWRVGAAGPDSYKISNVGLECATFIDKDANTIYCGGREHPARYAILPASDDRNDVFSISAFGKGNLVWGVNRNCHFYSPCVHLRKEVQGVAEQWKFTKVDEDKEAQDLAELIKVYEDDLKSEPKGRSP
ncbi:hypothetical protein C8R46DRAFT_1342557 [Mycena filopes]|nr:hypothetical protein C8R46DRAFT_1342557 [Mycena filopes]